MIVFMATGNRSKIVMFSRLLGALIFSKILGYVCFRRGAAGQLRTNLRLRRVEEVLT